MATGIKSDEGIAKDVVDSLYWDSRVDASKVAVTVDNGIVTLAGTVSSSSERAAAVEDAWVISGIRDVINQLKLDFRSDAPADTEIKSNIENSFKWDNDLYPSDIQVGVEAGWVTLEGSVDGFWKKTKTEDLAFSLRGVTGVTNKIAVVPTQTFADEKIAQSVINALDRNKDVDVDDIDVTVENGKVSLTGTVPDWVARRAAYNAARYARGVKEVEDQITVS